MTSSDREILLSINNQLQVLGERVTRIEQTQAKILQRQDNLGYRVGNLHPGFFWGFAIIALVIAIASTRRENSQSPAPIVQIYTYPVKPEVSIQNPKEEKVS